jgi:hypothetical protein
MPTAAVQSLSSVVAPYRSGAPGHDLRITDRHPQEKAENSSPGDRIRRISERYQKLSLPFQDGPSRIWEKQFSNVTRADAGRGVIRYA